MKPTPPPWVESSLVLQAKRARRLSSSPGRSWGGWKIILAVGMSWLTAPGSKAEPASEYEVKAALLHNLTQFVDWPAGTFSDSQSPWVIGILGRDPFGAAIDERARKGRHLNRSIVVKRFASGAVIPDCHILFVGGEEAEQLPRILQAIERRPILTVGETAGFAGRGGMIQFQKSEAGKIQLRIDLAPFQLSGLTVSPKLLRVSEVISAPPP